MNIIRRLNNYNLNFLSIYRLACELKKRNVKFFPYFLEVKLKKTYSCELHLEAQIGNVTFPHPLGIVIGQGVRVGDGTTIYQHVTLGGARVGDSISKNYPKIGQNCVIYAGAVIVGDITIGNSVTIGANAVVLGDIPDGATAVGVPARIIIKDKL